MSKPATKKSGSKARKKKSAAKKGNSSQGKNPFFLLLVVALVLLLGAIGAYFFWSHTGAESPKIPPSSLAPPKIQEIIQNTKMPRDTLSQDDRAELDDLLKNKLSPPPE